MKIVFDIGHPAHVHYFANTIKTLEKKGHQVFVLARQREFIFELLKDYNIEYISRGKGASSKLGKLLYLIWADLFFIYKLMFKKIDVGVGFASPYLAHASKVLGFKSIILDDTEHASINHKLYVPFASKIITPSCFTKTLDANKHTKVEHLIEELYLNEVVFKPNKAAIESYGFKGCKYLILRFIGWDANHDFGYKGLSVEQKKELITFFVQHDFKIILSYESEADSVFIDDKSVFAIKSPSQIHDLMYFSSGFIGESGTMSTEAALLGKSSLFISPLASQLGNVTFLEKKYTYYKAVDSYSAKEIVEFYENEIIGSEAKESTLPNNQLSETLLGLIEKNEI